MRGGRLLFEGLGFRMQAGEAVALTGANGSGKTSLLRAIAGLIRPACMRNPNPSNSSRPPRTRARSSTSSAETRPGPAKLAAGGFGDTSGS